MAGPRLTDKQREELFAPLFKRVVADLAQLANGDSDVLWALRRKLAKELMYLERGTPMQRKLLKTMMWARQNRMCAILQQGLAAEELRARPNRHCARVRGKQRPARPSRVPH